MILPTKHISAYQALIGAGAIILQELQKPMAISSLWKNVRTVSSIGNYERFILTLDMLYIMGALELENNIFKRVKK